MLIYGGADKKPLPNLRVTDDFITVEDLLGPNAENPNEEDQQKTVDAAKVKQTNNTQDTQVLYDTIMNSVDSANSEFKSMEVNKQLETLLNLMGSQIKENTALANKVRNEYCYAETVFYKILTFVGISEENAKTFSKWYIETAYIGRTSVTWRLISNTFSFMYNWKGLLAVVVGNIWLYNWIDQGGLEFIHDFLANNENTIQYIKWLAETTIGVGGKAIEWGAWLANPVLSQLGSINSMISSRIDLSSIRDFLVGKLDQLDNLQDYIAGGGFDADVLNVSFWTMITFAGLAVFIWAIYMLYDLVYGSLETNVSEFCAGV